MSQHQFIKVVRQLFQKCVRPCFVADCTTRSVYSRLVLASLKVGNCFYYNNVILV